MRIHKKRPNVPVAIHRSRPEFATWCSMGPQLSGKKTKVRQGNSIRFLKIVVSLLLLLLLLLF